MDCDSQRRPQKSNHIQFGPAATHVANATFAWLRLCAAAELLNIVLDGQKNLSLFCTHGRGAPGLGKYVNRWMVFGQVQCKLLYINTPQLCEHNGHQLSNFCRLNIAKFHPVVRRFLSIPASPVQLWLVLLTCMADSSAAWCMCVTKVPIINERTSKCNVKCCLLSETVISTNCCAQNPATHHLLID